MNKLEDLLLFEDKVGANKEIVKEKTKLALKKVADGEISTRGIENIAAYYLAKDGLFERYYEMVGSMQVNEYPTYKDFYEQEKRANMFFLWRAYTFLKEAQYLGLYNYENIKRKATTNLFAGITNCSSTSVEKILAELSSRGPKHAQLVRRERNPHAEKVIGPSEVYNLTFRTNEFISAFEKQFIRIKPEFGEVLQKYNKILVDIINLFRYSGLISSHNIVGSKKRGRVIYNYLHIHGEQAIEEARELHNLSYQNALMNLPVRKV